MKLMEFYEWFRQQMEVEEIIKRTKQCERGCKSGERKNPDPPT
jgi:hypothetical protein